MTPRCNKCGVEAERYWHGMNFCKYHWWKGRLNYDGSNLMSKYEWGQYKKWHPVRVSR